MAENIPNAASLAGKRIVTSFPVVAEKFFRQFETEATGKTKIKFVSGSVEAACQLGLADGIVDLVETGTTMRAAGLDIVEKIMDTQAVLIKNKKALHPELINLITRRIQGDYWGKGGGGVHMPNSVYVCIRPACMHAGTC